jgi:putative transcriptional regulator
VEFERDPTKSAATELNRGIGFARAAEIFTGRLVEWIDNLRTYGKARIRAPGRKRRRGVACSLCKARLGDPDHLRPPGKQNGARHMALIRMTSKEIAAQAAKRSPEEDGAFQRRMAATTEDEIRQQMIEDGEDPGAEPCFAPPVLAQDVRKKLGLTQPAFARLLSIPVATLRNWEQNRFGMEPAAQTLLKLIDREPEAALRALRGPQAA